MIYSQAMSCLEGRFLLGLRSVFRFFAQNTGRSAAKQVPFRVGTLKVKHVCLKLSRDTAADEVS